jgi:hypothetical protein
MAAGCTGIHPGKSGNGTNISGKYGTIGETPTGWETPTGGMIPTRSAGNSGSSGYDPNRICYFSGSYTYDISQPDSGNHPVTQFEDDVTYWEYHDSVLFTFHGSGECIWPFYGYDWEAQPIPGDLSESDMSTMRYKNGAYRIRKATGSYSGLFYFTTPKPDKNGNLDSIDLQFPEPQGGLQGTGIEEDKSVNPPHAPTISTYPITIEITNNIVGRFDGPGDSLSETPEGMCTYTNDNSRYSLTCNNLKKDILEDSGDIVTKEGHLHLIISQSPLPEETTPPTLATPVEILPSLVPETLPSLVPETLPPLVPPTTA